jgi:hypothetical protein
MCENHQKYVFMNISGAATFDLKSVIFKKKYLQELTMFSTIDGNTTCMQECDGDNKCLAVRAFLCLLYIYIYVL